MLSLTRKADYALIALVHLAQCRAHGETQGVSARRIASQFGLPLPLLMNILKELTQAGVVSSTRGAQGGYALAVEPESLTLRRIITVIDGPIQIAECADSFPRLPIVGQGCGIACTCPIRSPIQKLHQRIVAFLDQVTLADMMDSKIDVPLEQLATAGPDSKPVQTA